MRSSGAFALRRTQEHFAIKRAAAACGATAALNRTDAGSDRSKTEGRDGQGEFRNNETGKGLHQASRPVSDFTAFPEPPSLLRWTTGSRTGLRLPELNTGSMTERLMMCPILMAVVVPVMQCPKSCHRSFLTGRFCRTIPRSLRCVRMQVAPDATGTAFRLTGPP